MAELTEAQKHEYWRYNIRLTIVLLAIWALFGFVLGGLLAGDLNKVVIIGFPLGYWIAAQGALAVFVIEIAVYAKLMNRKDHEFGLDEKPVAAGGA
jgi:putative solute:sodium symporter small subunit